LEISLKNIGINKGHHIILHASYRAIQNAFPGIDAGKFLSSIQNIISPEGSLILPTFTYCFKRRKEVYEIFNHKKSPSKVGYLSEYFRNMPDVVRTSSPTHSFAMWGEISKYLSSDNSPESPLGRESIFDWLSERDNSYILLFGCDFTSMSFIHYLEIIYDVPWKDFFPWNYMKVIPVGESTDGEHNLKEVPGCSKAFVSFEKYLHEKKLIYKQEVNGTLYYYLSIEKLLNDAGYFFSNNYLELLCSKGSCPACDSRREFYFSSIKGSGT